MNTSILKDSTLIESKQGYNNLVEIRRSSTGQRFVYKFQGSLPNTRPDLLELTPFLYNHKIEKEVKICNLLQPSLPVPYCSSLKESGTAIYEFIEGTEVTIPWLQSLTVTKRLKLAGSIGELIAKLQFLQDDKLLQLLADACGDKSVNRNVRSRHMQRATKSLLLLKHEQVLTTSQTHKMQDIVTKLLPKVPLSPLRLIHGDIYFGNFFVDPSLSITGLIDWADSSEIDDPLLELVLTARWLSFSEFYEDWNNPKCHQYFDATIAKFNDLSPTKFDPRLCKDLIVFYEILWHCKVLIAEHAKKNKTNVTHFCHTLEKVLEVHQP